MLETVPALLTTLPLPPKLLLPCIAHRPVAVLLKTLLKAASWTLPWIKPALLIVAFAPPAVMA